MNNSRITKESRRGAARMIAIAVVALFAAMPGTAEAVEVWGQVRATASTTVPSGMRGIYSLEAEADAPVFAYSVLGDLIATGVTDVEGNYRIDIPAQVFAADIYTVSANTSIGRLRAIYATSPADINPLSETLYKRLRENNPGGDYRSGELALISGGLERIATRIDFRAAGSATDAVELLLQDEEFRHRLGSLTATYYTPGDTIREVEILKSRLAELELAYHEQDADAADAVFDDDATLTVMNRPMIIDEWLSIIRTPGKRYYGDFDFLDTPLAQVYEDTARLYTVAQMELTEKASGMRINDPLHIVHTFGLEDGVWTVQDASEIISDRTVCDIPRARIVTGGSSMDWTDVHPCIFRLLEQEEGNPAWGLVSSVSFAHDGINLFWRMEVADDVSAAERIFDESGAITPGCVFTLVMTSSFSELGTNRIVSVVNYKADPAFSTYTVTRVAPDGFIDNVDYIDDLFHVGPGYVEASVPLENIMDVGQDFLVKAFVVYDTGGEDREEDRETSDTVSARLHFSDSIKDTGGE